MEKAGVPVGLDEANTFEPAALSIQFCESIPRLTKPHKSPPKHEPRQVEASANILLRSGTLQKSLYIISSNLDKPVARNIYQDIWNVEHGQCNVEIVPDEVQIAGQADDVGIANVASVNKS